MKAVLSIISALVLAACGLETATSAATAAKLQADQSKNVQQIEKAKADLDAAMNKSNERLRQAGEN